jgi:hypothetical protein
LLDNAGVGTNPGTEETTAGLSREGCFLFD